MNITIVPGAATEDAAQIDEIVSRIEESMKELDSVIKNTIPEGIQTTWSESIRTQWEKYYTSDIPNAMENIKMSADNLRLAIEQVLQYNQGK